MFVLSPEACVREVTTTTTTTRNHPGHVGIAEGTRGKRRGAENDDIPAADQQDAKNDHSCV